MRGMILKNAILSIARYLIKSEAIQGLKLDIDYSARILATKFELVKEEELDEFSKTVCNAYRFEKEFNLDSISKMGYAKYKLYTLQNPEEALKEAEADLIAELG